MATQESWETRDKIIDALYFLRHYLGHFKRKFAELEAIKVDILDDPAKKADIKLLFDQDPELSMAEVVAEYQKAKSINDWIKANGWT